MAWTSCTYQVRDGTIRQAVVDTRRTDDLETDAEDFVTSLTLDRQKIPEFRSPRVACTGCPYRLGRFTSTSRSVRPDQPRWTKAILRFESAVKVFYSWKWVGGNGRRPIYGAGLPSSSFRRNHQGIQAWRTLHHQTMYIRHCRCAVHQERVLVPKVI